MTNRNFSYIAIDPDINLELVTKKAPKYRIIPYDFTRSFSVQVTTIARTGSTILWCKCKSDDFIRRAMPTMVMNSVGIPAVFSFSISYHIQTIAMLRANNIPIFGCGYVHDAMPQRGVGHDPVTMKVRKSGLTTHKEVIATFGKSVYTEPFLSMSAVENMSLVKNAMPDMWMNVDANTVEIMERAVIMIG
jgi:hypothetical protein